MHFFQLKINVPEIAHVCSSGVCTPKRMYVILNASASKASPKAYLKQVLSISPEQYIIDVKRSINNSDNI